MRVGVEADRAQRHRQEEGHERGDRPEEEQRAWAEGFLSNRGLARWSDFGTITPSSKALQNWPRAMSGGCIFLMKKLTENLAFPIGSSGHQFMFR